jgi:MEDS: MEthanogen/methylotroph, DcmR Sensory domain/Histidine kinase-, DNA gyrase B-, and HSP90-like ATPase
LTIEEATGALKDAVADVDRYLADSRLEIVSVRDWFLPGGTFDGERLTGAWYEKLASVSARGYAGMRVTGDTTWLSKKDWTHFCDYEDGLNEVIGNQHLIGTEKDASSGVLVAVQDSGSGLDPENSERLFDAFYTAKPSGVRMGLSICRSIVEAHGGRIWPLATPARARPFSSPCL